MDQSLILAQVDEEIEKLQKIRDLLVNSEPVVKRGRGRPKKKDAPVKQTPRRQLSAAGRKRIADAMKARWAKARAKKSSTPTKTAKPAKSAKSTKSAKSANVKSTPKPEAKPEASTPKKTAS